MADNYSWDADGLIIRRGFMPADLVDAYLAARGRDPMVHRIPTPYMDEPTIRDLCLWPDLADLLAGLIGEPPLLHLNLTGFRSSARAWHADAYLNPDTVGSAYAATWIALGDIHPEAGPFEFIPGSHRWPESKLTRSETWAMASAAERTDPDWEHSWPRVTERVVVPYFEKAMANHGSPEIHRFSPAAKGDLLVRHPYLLHRGSVPVDPDLERPAIISHYSGVSVRPDMPSRGPHHSGSGQFAHLTGGHV